MLHGHVVTLFDEAVVCVDVAAGSDDRLRAGRLVDARRLFRSEALLTRVEHHGVLEMLVPWLVHRLRSARILS